MATQEVNKPSSLPPYSEMILAAIDNLEEKDGSNKTAISKYIESTYGDLPESHSALLTDNLSRMKDNGDLVFIKNNYMRNPNPTGAVTPAKRGRGRPPKPKSASAIAAKEAKDAYDGPPRSRGRPPKPKDPLSVVATSYKVGSGRGRGRPPKKVKGTTATTAMDTADDEDDEDEEDEQETVSVAATTTVTSSSQVTGAPRGRGRPPKVKAQPAAVGV